MSSSSSPSCSSSASAASCSSTPKGATGRVFGFVYSGLDVGGFATPVFYGWLLDHGMPQAVLYTVFAFTALAILTVLQLPGQSKRVTA